MAMTKAQYMEWMHQFRMDSARHHLEGFRRGEWFRFISSEACLFFVGPDNQAVTINCELRGIE